MTKKIVEVVLNSSAKYALDDCTLMEALHKIKQWIQEYGGNAKLSIGEEYEAYSSSDNKYAYIHIVGKQEESDEEYEKRLKREQQSKLAQEDRDKKEFERLQAKFGAK